MPTTALRLLLIVFPVLLILLTRPALATHCPNDEFDDADSDQICGDVDSCQFDPENDEDSDELCTAATNICRDSPTWDAGFGGCSSYAPSKRNAAYCIADDACTSCGCACRKSCSDLCGNDDENDADGDSLCGDVDPCP
jgi:hypothetical protein